MDIRLNEIPKSGLALRYDVPNEEMDLDSTGITFQGVTAVDIYLEKIEQNVTLNGEVTTAPLLQCGRCLKEFKSPLKVHVHANYFPETENSEDLDFGDSSIEVVFYSGKHIEVDKLIREQILLALPLRPLCNEECKGLCFRCGQDLNMIQCGCVAENPGGPFSALQDFIKNKRSS